MLRNWMTMVFVLGFYGLVAQKQDPFVQMRDPFKFNDKKPTHKIEKQFTLEGIVYSGKGRRAAVLAHGTTRAVVQRGEQFEGHKLVVIGKNFVVLQRGKSRKKILID